MSEEITGDNGVVEPKASGEGSNSVAYETYERTLTQAKQSKAKQRELEEKLNALLAEREANEKSQLAEQNKYKELFEASEVAAKAAKEETAALVAAQTVARKREAVAAHIGSVSKPEFLQFVNLDNVDLDNPDSVIEEATRFKAEYPMVLKTATQPIPNSAAPGTPSSQGKPNLGDMESEDLAIMIARAQLQGT